MSEMGTILRFNDKSAELKLALFVRRVVARIMPPGGGEEPLHISLFRCKIHASATQDSVSLPIQHIIVYLYIIKRANTEVMTLLIVTLLCYSGRICPYRTMIAICSA